MNTTRFDQKTQKLLWHVELRFDLFEEGPLVSFSGLDDSLDAVTAIQLILDQPANQIIKEKVYNTYTTETNQWRCYLLQTMCPANSPLYHPLSIGSPIRSQLIQTDILEYPTIVVTKAEREADYELYTEEKFHSRSQSHLNLIESFVASESESSSGKSDSDEESSSDDSSTEESSDSSSRSLSAKSAQLASNSPE